MKAKWYFVVYLAGAVLAVMLWAGNPPEKTRTQAAINKYNLNKLRKTPGSKFYQEGYPKDNAAARQAYNTLRLVDPKTGLIPIGIREKELTFVRSNIQMQNYKLAELQ